MSGHFCFKSKEISAIPFIEIPAQEYCRDKGMATSKKKVNVDELHESERGILTHPVSV
jgi:hypothetical protein